MKPTSGRIDQRYSDCARRGDVRQPPGQPARWDGRWRLDVHNGCVQNGAVGARTPDIQLVALEVTPGRAYGYAKGDPCSQTADRL
jgi:hypothetical protein